MFTIHRASSLIVGLMLAAALAPVASAQQAAPKSKSYVSDNAPYLVTKEYRNLTIPSEKIAGFDSEPTARKYANDLNDTVRLSDGFYYSVSKRRDDEPNTKPSVPYPSARSIPSSPTANPASTPPPKSCWPSGPTCKRPTPATNTW